MEFKIGDIVRTTVRGKGQVVGVGYGQADTAEVRLFVNKAVASYSFDEITLLATDFPRDISVRKIKKGDRIAVTKKGSDYEMTTTGVLHAYDRGIWYTASGHTLLDPSLTQTVKLVERKDHSEIVEATEGAVLEMHWDEKNLHNLYLKRQDRWYELVLENGETKFNGQALESSLTNLKDKGAQFKLVLTGVASI